MEDNIKILKKEYKEKKKELSSSAERKQIRQDYKEMKKKLKETNKLIKKHNLLETTEEFLDKFSFQKLEDFKIDNKNTSSNKTLPESEFNNNQIEKQKKYSEEEIRKADEIIKQINK